jgi:chemotaxis regulatin CheY-phosphate phosphatase CheZ
MSLEAEQLQEIRRVAQQVIANTDSKSADDQVALMLENAADALLALLDDPQPDLNTLNAIIAQLNRVWDYWGSAEYELVLLVSNWRDQSHNENG